MSARSRTAAQRRAAARRRARAGGAGRRRWVFPTVIGAILVAGVVAVVLASGGSDADSSGEIGPPVTVDGEALPLYRQGVADEAVGTAAPELEGESFDGTAVTAGGATGRPQVVVFLAHWCPHCQAEVPRIVNLVETGAWPDTVDVVAVSTATSRVRENYPPSEWLDRERWPAPVLVDDDENGAAQAGSAAEAYGLSGYPFLVFLDADGKVVTRTSGEVDQPVLQAMVEQLATGTAVEPGEEGPSSPAEG